MTFDPFAGPRRASSIARVDLLSLPEVLVLVLLVAAAAGAGVVAARVFIKASRQRAATRSPDDRDDGAPEEPR